MGGEPEKYSGIENAAYYTGYVPAKVAYFLKRQWFTIVWDDDIPDRFEDLEPKLNHEYFGELVMRYGNLLEEHNKEMEKLKGYKAYIEDYVDMLTKKYKERIEWHESLSLTATDTFGKSKIAGSVLITMNDKKMTVAKALDIIDANLSEHQEYKAYLQDQLSRSIFWYRRYLPDDQKDLFPDEVILEKFKEEKEQIKSFIGLE